MYILMKVTDEAQFSSVQCFKLRQSQLIALNGIGELASLFLIMKILAGCIKPMGKNSVKWGWVLCSHFPSLLYEIGLAAFSCPGRHGI